MDIRRSVNVMRMRWIASWRYLTDILTGKVLPPPPPPTKLCTVATISESQYCATFLFHSNCICAHMLIWISTSISAKRGPSPWWGLHWLAYHCGQACLKQAKMYMGDLIRLSIAADPQFDDTFDQGRAPISFLPACQICIHRSEKSPLDWSCHDLFMHHHHHHYHHHQFFFFNI